MKLLMYQEDYNKKFGENLKLLIDSRGFTQKEVCDLAAVTEVSMSKYIHGRGLPMLPIACSIAEVLGVTLDSLVRLEELEVKK